MPVKESLRRLDDRFVPREGKASSRALRQLPWVLGVALLTHFASLFTEAVWVDGLVFGLLTSSVVTAFLYLPSARRDRSG